MFATPMMMTELPAETMPNDVTNTSIYLPLEHELTNPDDLIVGKSYYVIDIKDKKNVKENQIVRCDITSKKCFSSGPFQNYGKLKKIQDFYNNSPERGYKYYFEYGMTMDDFDPNSQFGSMNPHYYLYLDQDMINKPVEIEAKNIVTINDRARNVLFRETDVKSLGGLARKSRKIRKQQKNKRRKNNTKKRRRTSK
jgi:hypothetical protein